MRTAFAAAIILVVGSMGLILMDDKPSTTRAPRPPQPRQVSVGLLGPVETITGMEMPKGQADQRGVYLRVQEPADVTVQLPGGRTVQTQVKYVSVNVENGVVLDVHLLPLMRSLPYKEAIAELHRCLDRLGISPDDQMRKMMAEWPDDALGFDPVKRPGFYPHSYRAGMSLSESASLMVKMRSADDGGWFFVLTFEAAGPARRAARVSGRETAKYPDGDGARDKE
jgi:hypothetical protein